MILTPYQKPLLGVQLNRANPLVRGLVAAWTLNEGAGTTARDKSGNGIHGTLTGVVPAANSGFIGEGLAFDGSNDYVNMGDVLDIGLLDCSVCVRVRTTGSTTGLHGIAGKHSASSAFGRYGLYLSSAAQHKIRGSYAGATGAGTTVTSLSDIDDLFWHDVIVTFKQSSVMSIYFDGRFENSVDISPYAGNSNNAGNFTLGQYYLADTTTPGNFFPGCIAYVYVYNRVLSPSDAQLIHNFPYAMFEDNSFRLDQYVAAGTVFTRNVSDALSLSDSAVRMLSAIRRTAEALGIADATFRTVGSARSISDTVGIADEVGRYAAFSREAREALGITDEKVVRAAYARYLSDPVGLFDTAMRSLSMIRRQSDSLGLTDSADRYAAFVRQAAEGLGVTDASQRYASFLREAQELLGITDEEVSQAAYLRIFYDSVGLADTAWRSQGHVRFQSDAVGITDEVSVLIFLLIYRAVSETVGITDSQDRSLSVVRSISDALGVSDTLDKASAIARIMSELIGMTDSVDRTVEVIRNLSDQVGITDSAHRALSQVRYLTEVLGLSDDTDATLAAAAVAAWLMIALSLRRFISLSVASPFITMRVDPLEFVHVEGADPFASVSIARSFISLEAYKL